MLRDAAIWHIMRKRRDGEVLTAFGAVHCSHLLLSPFNSMLCACLEGIVLPILVRCFAHTCLPLNTGKAVNTHSPVCCRGGNRALEGKPERAGPAASRGRPQGGC